MDASERGRLINRLADLIERDRTYLAVSEYFCLSVDVDIHIFINCFGNNQLLVNTACL